MPLLRKLESLYNRPDFYNDITKQKGVIRNKVPNCYEDIYDGIIYQELCHDNILLSDNNI